MANTIVLVLGKHSGYGHNYSTHFTTKQQSFLDFVLSHYVNVGADELDQEKLLHGAPGLSSRQSPTRRAAIWLDQAAPLRLQLTLERWQQPEFGRGIP